MSTTAPAVIRKYRNCQIGVHAQARQGARAPVLCIAGNANDDNGRIWDVSFSETRVVYVKPEKSGWERKVN